MIYFDAAATTLQKPASVRTAAEQAMARLASPGRGSHAPAREAAELVISTRELAAELFSCQPERVVFTLNATHALNLAIFSIAGRGETVVTSGFEHNAVLRPLHALGARILPADRQLFSPETALQGFERALRQGASAAICTACSNVFGYELPIYEIAELCRRAEVPLILDAAQAAGHRELDQSRLQAAAIAMPGHKGLYGPQGTGLLLCGQSMRPLLYGGTGSQSRSADMPEELPERLEAGTLNVCGIAGLQEGLRFVKKRGAEQIGRYEAALMRRAARLLSEIPELQVFTDGGRYQSGVLSFRCRDLECESLAAALGRHGVAVRAGLHCAPMAHESAGTLERGTVRLSFSAFNHPSQVDSFVKILKTLLAEPTKEGILLAR